MILEPNINRFEFNNSLFNGFFIDSRFCDLCFYELVEYGKDRKGAYSEKAF